MLSFQTSVLRNNLIESDIFNDLEIFDIKFKDFLFFQSGYSKNHLESLLPEKHKHYFTNNR